MSGKLRCVQQSWATNGKTWKTLPRRVQAADATEADFFDGTCLFATASPGEAKMPGRPGKAYTAATNLRKLGFCKTSPPDLNY